MAWFFTRWDFIRSAPRALAGALIARPALPSWASTVKWTIYEDSKEMIAATITTTAAAVAATTVKGDVPRTNPPLDESYSPFSIFFFLFVFHFSLHAMF